LATKEGEEEKVEGQNGEFEKLDSLSGHVLMCKMFYEKKLSVGRRGRK